MAMEQGGKLILIYGTEEYLKAKKRKEILKEYLAENSMSYNQFSGRDIPYQEIAELAATMPFPEPVRVISLEDTGAFKGTADPDLLAACASLPESTVILFYEQAADASNKLFQLVKKRGTLFRFVQTSELRWKEAQADRSSIRKWVQDYLKAACRKIDGRTAEELMTLAGTDRMNLKSELDKLISYTESRANGRETVPVTHADIQAICSKTLQDRVFDMLAAKLSGDVPRALSLYEDLRALRVAPMKILFLLERQFQQVHALRSLAGERLSDAQIADRLQMKDWQLRKLKEQAQRMSGQEARSYMELSAQLEQKVKTGDLQDRLAVEMVLCV